MKNKKYYKGYLRKIFETAKPICKFLKTVHGYYLYDTGTNKIVHCSGEVYELLNLLMIDSVEDAIFEYTSTHGDEKFFIHAKEIVDAVETEKILMLKNPTQFGLSEHFMDVEGLLNSSIQSITLELTQDCTLRCSYCIYSSHHKEMRGFSRKSMSPGIAMGAIDFLKMHSNESDPVYIGFYGGEPLMKFPLLKECVEYSKLLFENKTINFSITTNATLMTPQIADFLLQNNFSVLVSLDGPPEIHDRYRLDRDGNGSYNQTISGLKMLADRRKEIKKGDISINAVYTPPHSLHRINTFNNHIKGLKWLGDVKVMAEYVSDGSIPPDLLPKENPKEDKDLSHWAFGKYKSGFEASDVLAKGVIEKKMATLIQRPVLNQPVDSFSLNGCCLPGKRKNYITTEGSILICEKISSFAPSIGNIFNGFDYDTIKNLYIEEYAQKSLKYCSKCWGIRLCDLCYIAAFNEDGKLDLRKKAGQCMTALRSLEKNLLQFITLQEEDPERLNYLYDYDIQ